MALNYGADYSRQTIMHLTAKSVTEEFAVGMLWSVDNL
jgi:hypothetical protein